MLPTVWQGLVHSQIKSLTVKFPTCKTPKPVSIVPPIPSLVSLKVLDIDPLCYVDDISRLLAESRSLRELSIVWSPRMREANEPSVNLSAMFGRCRERPLQLRKIAIKNLFTYNDDSCPQYHDASCLEEITAINSIGDFSKNSASAFVELPMRKMGPPLPRLRFLCTDRPWEGMMELLTHTSGLEELYIPSPKKAPPRKLKADSIRDTHIEAMTRHHGQSLRHLLLPSQWRLTSEHIKHLAHHCPNLKQLGFAATPSDFMSIRSLLPSLPKLTAVRLLEYPYTNSLSEQWHDFEDWDNAECIDTFVNGAEYTHLPRWIDFGDERVYEIDKIELPEEASRKTRVRQRDLEAVKDIGIWKFDSFEI